MGFYLIEPNPWHDIKVCEGADPGTPILYALKFTQIELEEKQRAKGMHNSIETLSNEVGKILQDYITEFLGLAPSEAFKKNLQQKVQAVIK